MILPNKSLWSEQIGLGPSVAEPIFKQLHEAPKISEKPLQILD